MIAFIITLCAFFVYYDATKNKIGKIPDNKGFTNMSAGMWSFGVLLLFIVVFPLYLFKRSSLIELSVDKPQTVSLRGVKLAILGLISISALVVPAYNEYLQRFENSNSAEVSMVKEGSIGSCPSVTVENMVSSFMGSPSWDSGVTDDGQYFVNIGGDITFKNKDARAILQFFINKSDNSFTYNAFEINELRAKNFKSSLAFRISQILL